MKITELDWKPHPICGEMNRAREAGVATFLRDGGELALVEFPNGYSASCLRGGPFYTDDGTYEIGVKYKGALVYDTPVTPDQDVLGYQTEEEANAVLEAIAALPPRES